MTLDELKAKAVAMLDMAYVPYSHFPVGAAAALLLAVAQLCGL